MAASGWPAVHAQVSGTLLPQQMPSAFPAGASFELQFEVSATGDDRLENRVVFGTLRSTAPIAAITLLDPARRRIWRRTPSELGLTPRNQAARPELGDAIALPEIRDAASGRWTLLLERAAPKTVPGRLLLAWRVLPRYDLVLTATPSQVAAGQTLLAVVHAFDYGVPIAGLKQIELLLLDAGGQVISREPALEAVRSREGILLSNEPGSYVARLVLPRPGAFQLQARHVFGGSARAVTRGASIEINAGAPGGTLQLASVRLDIAPNGCARGLVFRFEVDVVEPGTYVCNLLLRAGDPAAPRASGSASLITGRSTIDVTVSAAKWAAAGNPSSLARASLLRIDNAGVKLLADFNDLSLAGHAVDTIALCK